MLYALKILPKRFSLFWAYSSIAFRNLFRCREMHIVKKLKYGRAEFSNKNTLQF